MNVKRYKEAIHQKLFVDIQTSGHPCCKGRILLLEVKQALYLDDLGQKVTMVLLVASEPIKTRNHSILRYGPTMPTIHVLRKQCEVDEVMCKMDVASSVRMRKPRKECQVITLRSNTETEIVPGRVINRDPIICESAQLYPEVMRLPARSPRVNIANFCGWQVQVRRLIKENSESNRRVRTINVLKSRSRGTGRTTFLQTLKYSDPTLYLILEVIPPKGRFLEIVEAKEKTGEWSGACLIFDVPWGCTRSEGIYTTLMAASDLEWCPNVWVFSDWWPRVEGTCMNSDCWSFFETSNDEWMFKDASVVHPRGVASSQINNNERVSFPVNNYRVEGQEVLPKNRPLS